MEDKDSVEIDPEKLSDDVADELVEEDIIDKEEADVVSNEVWLEQINKKDPNEVSFIDSLKLKFGDIQESINNFTQDKIQYIENYKTIYADVISVNPDKESEKVTIKLRHSAIGVFDIDIDPKSTNFSNLIEYYSVNNPKDLENKKLVVTNKSFESEHINSIVIPKNVSTSGKIRFKMYSICREVLRKTRNNRLYNSSIGDIIVMYAITGFMSFFSLLFSLTILTVGTIPSIIIGFFLMIPSYVWFTIMTIHIIYLIVRSVSSILLYLTESNYSKETKINL